MWNGSCNVAMYHYELFFMNFSFGRTGTIMFGIVLSFNDPSFSGLFAWSCLGFTCLFPFWFSIFCLWCLVTDLLWNDDLSLLCSRTHVGLLSE